MNLSFNDKKYNVKIIKKRNTKNTYIRVKDDFTILVTTSIFTSDNSIMKIVEENEKSIIRMIEKASKRCDFNSKFFFWGKEYDIIYTNENDISFGKNKVFVGREIDINKYMKKVAGEVFKERLDYWYSSFSCEIPYPSLTIRSMKSRWGVCNVQSKRVTLNLELIKKIPECLDYVIVHELSHLIHANHSKEFWNLVGENYKDYKKVRKILKEY